MTDKQRVLDFINRYPGRDDDQIAAALCIPYRQAVNQICRKLSDEGKIERYEGPTGKILNIPTRHSRPIGLQFEAPSAVVAPSSAPAP